MLFRSNANTIQAGASTISLLNGTASAPSLSFVSEPNTGIYRAGTGQFNIAVVGTNRFTLTASGLSIAGTGNFTGGISGGTF